MNSASLDLPPALYRRLRDFARRRVADPALADDLTQDALARALASASQLRDPERVEAWLYRALHNVIADHYRGLRPVTSFAELGMEEGELAASVDDDELAAAAEICVGAMLNAMDGEDGSVLAAVYRNDETQHAMARRLGIPASTVKSRIQRARRRLRLALDLCCRIELDAGGDVVGFAPLSAEHRARCGPAAPNEHDASNNETESA
jgi:RNA polymerase sigma-70 factor (ECF subfamily)